MATAIGSGFARAGGALGRASRNLMVGYMLYFLILGLIFLFLLFLYIFIAAIGLQLGIAFTCDFTGCISAWDRVIGLDFIGLLDRLMAGILFFIAAPVGIIVFLLSVIINPVLDLLFIISNIFIDIINSTVASIISEINPDIILNISPITWTKGSAVNTSQWMPDFAILVNTLKGILITPFDSLLGIRE